MPQGSIVKVDNAGHDRDHTAVGQQPVTWDIAGAIVEWGLKPEQVGMLIDAFYASGGPSIEQAALHYYRMCYAAFRVGQCHLCAGSASGHDSAEEQRLWSAFTHYRDELARLLNVKRA
jgi:hypothetical protein